MAIISEASLDFARSHFEKYYDSDFFPKPNEFEALWHFWSEVKKELMSRNISKLFVTPPTTMTISKPKGGFRVVHQLEPLDALVYTAVAAEAAQAIEAARFPADEHVACSYRIALADGSFFADGSGWRAFGDKTEQLADEFEFVLVTDITDFYNQIYLHRLNNAIELADAALKPLADDIEVFLGALNSKNSQGVPVGPAASIIFSEAVLIDVDRFITDQGAPHTRYVDDIRVFSNSERTLRTILERLTMYLYENHRLTISSEKTRIENAKEFVEKQLHNQYATEKSEILEELHVFNPYTGEVEILDFEPHEPTVDSADASLVNALNKVLSYDLLDLGLIRSTIRTARRQKSQVLIPDILDHFEFLVPAVNDVMLYLRDTASFAGTTAQIPKMRKIVKSVTMDSPLVRYWVEWYLSQFVTFMNDTQLSRFVFQGPNVENQAVAAITTKNVAWVRDHKGNIYNLGNRARRAVLHAARVLPSDERKHWLKYFAGNSPVQLDKWVARWVEETA
ncbi:MAG TPA: RNA-directed DNA polymerase [Steroidobacteraceae bacterium]|nr:RNA-directed DNA polymerase [Steroidobacteraceae bacterium]